MISNTRGINLAVFVVKLSFAKSSPSSIREDASLSTVVLNSRDWLEIVWLMEILCFIKQPCNRLYPKKPTGMHWLGYNDAVSWLNEVKTQMFQPTAYFENFEIYLYFICLLASLPTVRPGCARCRAPEISHDKGNGSGFTKMLF